MTHRDVYNRLVCDENRQLLHPLIESACTSIGYKLLDMVICGLNGIKYIECSIDTQEIFHAVMIGFILDITKIEPEYDKKYYYMPVIMFCTTYEDHINKYIDKHQSTRHELMHLKDILDLIEKDPEFTEKVMRYSMNKQDLAVDDLPKSIEFEMSKSLFENSIL